jgi:hypothetical protein
MAAIVIDYQIQRAARPAPVPQAAQKGLKVALAVVGPAQRDASARA